MPPPAVLPSAQDTTKYLVSAAATTTAATVSTLEAAHKAALEAALEATALEATALEAAARSGMSRHAALELQVADLAAEVAHLVEVRTVTLGMCGGAACMTGGLHWAAGSQVPCTGHDEIRHQAQLCTKKSPLCLRTTRRARRACTY